MKNLTWQNPEQLFVAQELINKVKSKCCGIKVYEDDNETYAYERGGYSAIQMKWDNKHQTFTLFAPIGKMPPKLENRKFKIQIFTPLESGHVSVIEKDIIYNNKTMKLKF